MQKYDAPLREYGYRVVQDVFGFSIHSTIGHTGLFVAVIRGRIRVYSTSTKQCFATYPAGDDLALVKFVQKFWGAKPKGNPWKEIDTDTLHAELLA